MDDLISIIVPVYNVDNYLESCLKSIVNQTYNNIEIILVDDGSTDESGKICDDYCTKSCNISVIHQENQGASVTRNVGIKHANGEYIVFVDADDEVGEKYIEYLYYLIKKYNTKMSIAAYTIISKNNKKIDLGNGYKEEKLSTKQCLERLLKEQGFTVSPCAKMYEKSLFKDIKFPEGKLFEDNGTVYKFIMECNQIAYGNESYYYYYKRDNSSTTSEFNINKIDLIELTDKMCKDISNKYPDLEGTLEKKKITARFSILRMINLKEKNSEINEKRLEIEKYIKARKKYILNSKDMDKRDRFALISLIIGRRFFYFAWNLYCKIKY